MYPYAKTLAAGVVAAMMISAASAAPTVYTSSAAFTAATASTTTETFDGVSTGSTPIVTPGFTVSGGTTGGAGNETAFYGSGRSLQYSTRANEGLTFTFNSAITAFGFTIYDLGTTGATTLSATYAGGTATFATNYSGASAAALFFGFTDAANPFTTLTLTNTSPGDFIEIDNVRFGAAATTGGNVPEPASWAMMVAGFGAIGTALRRRRQAVRVTFA